MLFFFTGLGLMAVSIIIFSKDYGTESTKWLAALCLFSSFGAFSVTLNTGYLILADLAYYIAPYCVLMYGLSTVLKNYKRAIYIIFLIPVSLSFYYLNPNGNSEVYFRQLSIWCVPYILIGVFLTVYSCLKEKSHFMKRYKLINIIILSPFLIYVAIAHFLLRCFNINNGWRIYPIVFLFQFICFIYAAYKYGVFGVRMKFDRYKFAFENIIEFITDSIIILDENLEIIDINKIFFEKFKLKQNKHYKQVLDVLRESSLNEYEEILMKLIMECQRTRTTIKNNIEIIEKNDIRYFEVQVNCVIIKGDLLGTIILFKDITDHRKNVELMIERERLWSLSQLIGGVAHNLKTPLMSASGGLLIIKNDTNKLKGYINKDPDNQEAVENIINEINSWQERTKDCLVYMTEIIDTIKGQLKESNSTEHDNFYIKDVIKKVIILMDFKLRENKCKLLKEIELDKDTQMVGDINSLVQVLSNIIGNAIEANKGDAITLNICEKNKNIIIAVKNFGDRIPDDIQEKLFNKMITTKGKNGTGLGLYISRSIIKSKFKGEIYFKSSENETTFFIKLPKEREV